MWREHRASGLRKQYVKEIITESHIITAISQIYDLIRAGYEK